MSTTKHTPGPWYAEDRGVGGSVYTNATPDGELKVITRDIHGRTDDELRANTDLIAAAPELLAALEEMVRRAEADGHRHSLDGVRAAIAKAKGKA